MTSYSHCIKSFLPFNQEQSSSAPLRHLAKFAAYDCARGEEVVGHGIKKESSSEGTLTLDEQAGIQEKHSDVVNR